MVPPDRGALDWPRARQFRDHVELSFAARAFNRVAGLALSRLQDAAEAARSGAGGVMGLAGRQMPLLRRLDRPALCPDRNRGGAPGVGGLRPLWLYALAAGSAGADRRVGHGACRLAGASGRLMLKVGGRAVKGSGWRRDLLQDAQIFSQGRIQPLMHKGLERRQILGERASLQSVEIGFAVLETYGNRRIAAPDQ